MNREEKAKVIATLKDDFAQNKASFLVNFKGLSVGQIQDLRNNLRSKGGRLKVTKARLMKLAADNMPQAEVLLPYFKEQVGLVFAQEAPTVAKVLSDFAKEHEALTIVAGSLEQALLDKNAVERIASLPSKEVLLAQMCGTLNAPIVGLITVLNAVQLQLIWTLKQIEQKKKQ